MTSRALLMVNKTYNKTTSIDSKFQCEHNLNQLLGSIPSFRLKITSSNCIEVSQNQGFISYGKTKKNLRQSAQICADSADLS